MSTVTFKREHLHIVNNSNESSKAYDYGYDPIVTGALVPPFYLPSQNSIAGQFIAGSLTREAFISLQDLLDDQQPLVIAFLGAPGQAAVNIQQLEKLHADIQEHSGRLLVLTAIESKYLRRQFKQSGTLNIFYDKDNAVAELFGLYDIENPLWQWVSGIEEEEQSLPALYVVAPDRKVAYSFVDYKFSLFSGSAYPLQLIGKDLLHTINEIATQYHYQPAAYKLVS